MQRCCNFAAGRIKFGLAPMNAITTTKARTGRGHCPLAAFVLMVFVLGLNLLVDRIGRSHARASGLSGVGGVV